jgi:hypothetical protein
MRHTLVGLLIVLLAFQSGCGQSSTNKRAEAEKAERGQKARAAEEQRRAILTDLGGPHRAAILSTGSFTWTADVQDALMPEDGRPVAGIAALSDIERNGKSYLVRLVYGDFPAPLIVLLLKCDRPNEKGEEPGIEFGDRMVAMTGPSYAFVAKVDSVRATRGFVTDQIGSDVRRLSWAAEGKCLALRKMPA